ncbi:MAG: Rne/Rng family ribonuclease [Byssovorax sp.]
MAKNLLVINVDIRETRVALIENGIIAELHIERETSRGSLGNIYLGKVSRVLPGMQAAFIDVGLERAAFLHVEDLIRPDDFEAYLAGHRRGGSSSSTDEDRASGPTVEEAATEALALAPPEPSEAGESAAAEREVDIELPTALDVADAAYDERDEDEERAEEERADEEERAEAEALADDVDVDVEEPDADEGASFAAADELAGDEGAPDDREEAAADEASAEDTVLDEPAQDEPAGGEPAGDEPAFEAAASVEGEIEASGGEAAPGAEGEAGAAAPAGTSMVPAADGTVTPHARSRRGSGRGRVRRSGTTRDRRPGGDRGAEAAPQPAAPAPQEQRSRDGGRREGGREASGQGGREGGGRDGGRGRGRDNRDGGRGRRDNRDSRDSRGRGGREGRGRDDGRDAAGKRALDPMRVSKTTPIREVVREGQEVLVQISKEPIGTKGARVTSHISLPGRYVVYLPTVEHVGISKRIGSDKERSRLREAIEAMKPPQGGLIVRTLAEGLTKKQLKADVGYLVRLWGEVVKKRETGVRAPVCLYTELDLVLKAARDLFTDDIEKIVIDSATEHNRLQRFVEMFLPERVNDIELYDGNEPIFDAYGIEDEIQRAQSRKVPLPSGGHLIIDQAEALTAIDVNTGRFVGKGSKDLEETILATNLEAVEEIAYQLRFRNIGGLIILDLIDMERASNRERVRKRMEELLSRDKAKTTLNRISDLGLIEMTRKRTRESLGRMVLEPCFYCDGTGQLQSKQTIAYEILRQIRRERSNLPGYVIIVNAHPAVIDLLKSDERVAVQEAERLFQRRIELIPRKEYHLEQFDLQGR